MKKILLYNVVLCGLQTAVSASTLSNVSGTWYDPAYDGSGFNISDFSSGLYVYFYGYKGNKNGEAQWLIVESGVPTPIEKGKTYIVKLVSGFVGNGGTLTTKPTTKASGTREWGEMQLTFNSCTSGTAILKGKDGTLTHNIVKLASIVGLDCKEVNKIP